MDPDDPALIDLGLRRDETGSEARRPLTWRRLRPAALALVTALLLTTGGSALPSAPVLVEIATVPYSPEPGWTASPGATMLLTDDRLVTAVLRPGGSWLISAYEPERAELVWTYLLPARNDSQMTMRQGAGLVLLSGPRPDGTAGMWTVALEAATGRERWSLPHQLWALYGGDIGLTVDPVFDGESATTENGPAPGADYSYVSPWGTKYDSGPVEVLAGAVTLGTGEMRWQSEPVAAVHVDLGDAYPDGATVDGGRSDALVVTTSDGAVEVWDPGTGLVRHRFPTPRPDSYLTLDRDLMLIWEPQGGMTVYSTEDYRLRWTRPVAENGSVGFCDGSRLICESNRVGWWQVVDPSTGRPSWQGRQGHQVRGAAGHLIEFVRDDVDSEPTRTVDPRTGQTLIDLTGWDHAVLRSDQPVLLARADGLLGPTWLGLLAPGATAPTLLGQVPVGLTDCQIGASLIACATYPRDLRIWRYRSAFRPGGE
ncbi:hypothetical protein ACI2K4_07240 [Micromonospora sp. NPDC050397]|uniref:hypothetical protein n=1 Tax=Micromonospora sp. NPDC050397 TaxID=3364279 RepID=UPI00384A5DD6